jgi:hypothetical protein
MIRVYTGGMSGRLGPFLWVNGADMAPTELQSTLRSEWSPRFGHWRPVSHAFLDTQDRLDQPCSNPPPPSPPA